MYLNQWLQSGILCVMALMANTSWAQVTLPKCASIINVVESTKNLSNSTSAGFLQFTVGAAEITNNGATRDNYCTVSWPSAFPIIIKSSGLYTGLVMNLDHTKARITTAQGVNSCAGFPNDNHVNNATIEFNPASKFGITSTYHSHSFQAFSGVGSCRFEMTIPYTVTIGPDASGSGFTNPFLFTMLDYLEYQNTYARYQDSFIGAFNASSSSTGTTIYPRVQCTVTPTNTTVTLPDVNVSAFTEANPLAGATNFQFNWTSCPVYRDRVAQVNLNYKVKMTWNFTQDPNTTDKTHIANTADVGSASSNIVVVVKDRGATNGTNPNVFIKNEDKLDLGSPVNQTVNRNFTAYYKATSFPAAPGAVKGTAVFTMTYE